ncbi:MAG: sigma-70 family RNA polymerase sigma factor [Saprospiraceae bacterium]
MDSEQVLWEDFRKGSEKAFEQLYAKFYHVLFDYAVRFSPDKALVKDCIQELFIEIWEKRRHIAQVSSVKGYLFVSIRRKIFRKLATKENQPQHIDSEYQFTVVPPHDAVLIRNEQHRQQTALLEKHVSNLSPRQKEVIFLKFHGDLSYQEISEIMELKDPRYARQIIYRILDKLREVMKIS